MTDKQKRDKGPFGVILVADDTQVMRHACQRALERVGHRVILASNGEEAISAAQIENIDVALLDIRMPGPSGLDVLKSIKKDKPFVEVIIMTAYATQDVAEEATHLGANSFLTKPFENIRTLLDAVSQAVTRKRLNEDGLKGPVSIEDLLLKEGLVDNDRLRDAKVRAAEWNIGPSEALVRMGAIQAEDIDWVIAKALDIPFVRLNADEMEIAAVHRIPAYLARRYKLIPIMVEKTAIHVAVDDPFNREGLDAVRRKTGLEPIMVKGHGPEIELMIRHFYEEGQASIESLVEEINGRPDPDLFRELMDKAGYLKLDKMELERDDAGGRRKWVFKIEGVLAEEEGEGEE